MKTIILLLSLLITTPAFAQTAKEYINSGLEKHRKLDYKGAIADYTKAIELSKDDSDLYLNRGNCEYEIKEYEPAIGDFNKTIELSPKNARAYYSRAVVNAAQKKYKEALPDLDMVIELNPSIPNSLTLRGQLRAITGNMKGACEDFITAKNNGDKGVEQYLTQFCSNIQGYNESIQLNLPENENWKIGADQENTEQRSIDYIHTNETIENWTELVNTFVIKGVKGMKDSNADVVMNLMFEQSKKNAPEAKLTFIEKDEKAEFPWIIFTVESPWFNNDPTPESQLWYIVQGKQALYNNFRAIKKAIIPNELKEKWVAFFKSAKVVYK